MSNTTLNPYKAAKVVNAFLEKVGLKKVPPQMLYNYTQQRLNKGQRPLIKAAFNDQGIVEVDPTDLERWMTEYACKKLAKLDEAKPEQKFDEVTIVGDRSF